MIHHKLDLIDIDQSIIRPLVIKVANHIKEITGIRSDAPVLYIEADGQRAQYGSTLGSNEAGVKLASNRLLTIEATTKFDEVSWSGQAGHNQEHALIFADPGTGLFAKPVYQSLEASVQFSYETPSRNEAVRWRNDASHKASQWRDVLTHDASYHYLIPDHFWMIAHHVHSLREGLAGYGEDFATYIKRHTTNQVTQISSQTGEHTKLAIRETQRRILGTFDFTIDPEPVDKRQDNGTWSIRFTYNFRFDCPTAISVDMPIVIHNQAVDDKFIPQSLVHDSEVAGRASQTTNALSLFEADNHLRSNRPSATQYYSPGYDRWKMVTKYDHCRLLASFLVAVEQPNQEVLLDLKELGLYNLDSLLADWLKAGAYKHVHLPYAGPVQVVLYENEQARVFTDITVDENLVVKSLIPLDPRKRYRVTLMLLNDFTRISPQAIKELTQYPELLCKLIKLYNISQGQLNRFLPLVDLRDFYHCATQGGLSREDVLNSLLGPYTVMSAYIEAYRQPFANR